MDIARMIVISNINEVPRSAEIPEGIITRGKPCYVKMQISVIFELITNDRSKGNTDLQFQIEIRFLTVI